MTRSSSSYRYTRARWLLASVALVATGSPGTPANVVSFDVLPLSSSASSSSLSSLLAVHSSLVALLSLLPLPLPFLFEVVDRQTGRSEKSREDSARSSCATRLYNRIVSKWSMRDKFAASSAHQGTTLVEARHVLPLLAAKTPLLIPW